MTVYLYIDRIRKGDNALLKDSDLIHEYDPNNLGLALCWVIGKDVLYDLPLNYNLGKMFLETNNVEDISDLYPEHDGLTVRLKKDDGILEELQTSEYFGSVLLSDPVVVNLDNHKRGSFVSSPYAKFDNYEFFPQVNMNPKTLDPWFPHEAPKDGKIANCYKDCNCGLVQNAG